jgi:hypothetical protein
MNFFLSSDAMGTSLSLRDDERRWPLFVLLIGHKFVAKLPRDADCAQGNISRQKSTPKIRIL